MCFLRRIVKFTMILIWLPIIGFFSFWIHLGGWGAVKRVSKCTRIWGAGIARILNAKINIHGNPDEFKGCLIVSNHMGFFDILVHSSIFPIRFAPKIDIKKWPFLGWYLGISRPIWIDRSSPRKSAEVAMQIRATMEHEIPMLVYPEGTSTSGKNGILPFKSTPFEAVASVGNGFPILPILTFYQDGDDGLPIAWYGDMLLFPSFMRILGYKKIEADVYLLPVIMPQGRSRKELAQYVHDVMDREYWRIKGEREKETPTIKRYETVMA